MATILLIEDNLDIRETVADILHGEGYSVLTAVNGRDALEQLQNALELPHLILLDLLMPQMGGRELRAVLREKPEWQAIPIVVCSASVDERLAAELSPLAGTLLKPMEVPQLLALLASCCPVAPVPNEAPNPATGQAIAVTNSALHPTAC